MATTNIELDIENITGVSDANDQFIISAQKFVVSSVPKNLLSFAQKASSASTDGSAIAFSVNDSILDVQRNGYSCTEIPQSESKWALDSSSLKFATSAHPVWYHKQGSVHIAPVTDGSNAGYVFYVDYSKIDDDCDLRNAVIYHAASSEFSKLATAQLPSSEANLLTVSPDVPSLTTIAYSSPGRVDASSPTFTTATISASSVYTGSSPNYTSPTQTISGVDWATEYPDSQIDLSTSLSAITTNVGLAKDMASTNPVPPEAPDVPNFSFAISTNLPTYTSPVVGGSSESITSSMDSDSAGFGTDVDFLNFSKWFSVASEFIESEEDVELAGAQLSKISTYLNSYSQALQDQLNLFNTELQKYQAELSKEMQQAQYEQQGEYTASLSKYQAEVQQYGQEINETSTSVSNYINVSQGYINEMQSKLAITQTKISEFQAKTQDALNSYNKELSVYQIAVQESMQEIQVANQVNIAQAQADLQVAIANEDRSVQRELQNASNDMQRIVQDNNIKIQKYQAESTAFASEVSKEIQEYQNKSQISERYSRESDKYYNWSQLEINNYIKNNAKMIGLQIASSRQQGE